MRVAGLFAGIGGLEIGFRAAGHETLLLCEVWEPAQTILRARFPECHLAADIRTLRSLPGATDVVIAGFPCQDLSQAGTTAGIEGERSGLVGQVFRLLDQRRAPWVVLENVSFMLELERGKAIDRLTRSFEERGYRWAYRVIDSQSFLSQRRKRVYFVATNTGADPADVLLADEAFPHHVRTTLARHAHGFYWTEGTRGLGWAVDAIPTLKNGSTIGIPSPPAILLPDGMVITPDIRDAERLQGFAADWTAPAAEVGRASFRWTLVGNAVTVPVAEWLGNRLASPGRYERRRDRPFASAKRWPRAARFDGSSRHAVDITEYPVWLPRRPLHQFLNFAGTPLSVRATRGFVSRAQASSLRFADGFLDGLKAHLVRMESLPESGSRRRSAGAQAKAA
jgi:DNA (cytosine-5)-methyltransferase 1